MKCHPGTQRCCELPGGEGSLREQTQAVVSTEASQERCPKEGAAEGKRFAMGEMREMRKSSVEGSGDSPVGGKWLADGGGDGSGSGRGCGEMFRGVPKHILLFDDVRFAPYKIVLVLTLYLESTTRYRGIYTKRVHKPSPVHADALSFDEQGRVAKVIVHSLVQILVRVVHNDFCLTLCRP